MTEIVCTNSVPLPADHPKLHVLSVAPALAEAISRIHNGESVSALFDRYPRAKERGPSRVHDLARTSPLTPRLARG